MKANVSFVGDFGKIGSKCPDTREHADWSIHRYDDFDGYLASPRERNVPQCVVVNPAALQNGWNSLPEILAKNGAPFFVVCAAAPSTEQTVGAMKAGAVSVVDIAAKKQARSPAELLDSAIEEALRRSRAALARMAAQDTLREREGRLTRREHEVFERIVRGMMNKQIGVDLGINERTVKIHRANVMSKLDALSVAELVRIASLLGLQIGD